MTRANARELALQLIYAREFTGEEPESVIASRLDRAYYPLLAAESELYTQKPSPAQRRYLDTVVVGVANRTEELNAVIARYSVGWDISRISRLTRCAMQLALFEAQYVEDVPMPVAISEAVRLAKKYDGDEAGAFVNGILGSFSRASAQAAPPEETPCP